VGFATGVIASAVVNSLGGIRNSSSDAFDYSVELLADIGNKTEPGILPQAIQ
jgi:hypothetical protein